MGESRGKMVWVVLARRSERERGILWRTCWEVKGRLEAEVVEEVVGLRGRDGARRRLRRCCRLVVVVVVLGRLMVVIVVEVGRSRMMEEGRIDLVLES